MPKLILYSIYNKNYSLFCRKVASKQANECRADKEIAYEMIITANLLVCPPLVSLSLVRLFFFQRDEHFVYACAVHVHYLEVEAVPFRAFAGLRYVLHLFDDEAR